MNRLELTLTTADDCIGTRELIGPKADEDMVWDEEPDSHTQRATLEVVSPEGKILERLTMSGHHWRDLEGYGLLGRVIEAVRAGTALAVAVPDALEQCPEPPEQGEPTDLATSCDPEAIMDELAQNLLSAVLRFELEIRVGNPIFSTAMPDARRALALYDTYRRMQPTDEDPSKTRSLTAAYADTDLAAAFARALEHCPETPEQDEPTDPTQSADPEAIIDALALSLLEAVKRFERENLEGNPIFSAALPDARKALALFDTYRGALPAGEVQKPRSLMGAYAEHAGMSIETVMAALRERPDGSTLIGWSDFRAGWEARVC